MDISSSNYFSVSASTNKGMSGMVSSMDTESMVKQMLAGTQSKIDKQLGLKQQTEWKQEIYRDIISSINDFQAKYLDTSYGSSLTTNFASTAFFNSMISSVTGGDGVRVVSTGTSAAEGTTKVKIGQLAAAATLGSTKRVSTGSIVGAALNEDALTAKLDKKIGFTVGADSVQVDLNGITTDDGMVKAINDAFAAQSLDVKAEIFDGRLRLISDESVAVGVDADKTTSLGLSMTGLSSYSTGKVTDADGNDRRMLRGSYTNAAAGPSFTVTLDGVQKQITLNSVTTTGGKVTAQDAQKALDTELKKAFGDYVAASLTADGKLTLTTSFPDNGKGHELYVTGVDAKVLGITPGSTTALNTGTKLKDMATLGLTGDKYEFTINGTNFSFTGNDSVGTVMNTINNSGAGVRMTYSALTDSFQMEATATGKEYGIKIEQTQGNLLSGMFGDSAVHAAGSLTSRELTVDHVDGTAMQDDYSAKSGASLKFSVDGVNYTFTLPQVNGEAVTYSKDEIAGQFNAWLATNFQDDSGNARLTYDKDTGALNVTDGSVVKFAKTAVDTYNSTALAEAKKSDLGLVMGFTLEGASNVATKDNLADAVQLAGLTITPELSAAFKDGRLVLTGTVPPLGSSQLTELFGASAVNGAGGLIVGDGQLAADAVAQGKDLEMTVNGVDTTRSSNTFTIDGITMEAVKEGAETTIGTKRDTETIVDGFKSFVEDYNKLVKKLTDLVDEKQNFREYAPLTDEQKDKMSERQIELWEEKAKEGLLHRDSAVDSFLSQMRLALYTKPAGAKLALYDIGIETTKWEDKGQLKMDETALRNALASDPTSVMTLFTSKTDGLGAVLSDIIKDAANPSAASPGTLVQIAGVKGWASETNNNLTNSISSIASRIKDLQAKYESERTRYWNQFNAMESALASFNSQSNMIAQQFSSGY